MDMFGKETNLCLHHTNQTNNCKHENHPSDKRNSNQKKFPVFYFIPYQRDYVNPNAVATGTCTNPGDGCYGS